MTLRPSEGSLVPADREAMQRLEDETLERCFEVLEGRPVLVKSDDPRLRAQRRGVRF